MSEDFPGLVTQTPGHDPFEQSHMAPGPPQADKTATNEMPALAVDGPMSMLPQLGDSEEKLRQVGQISILLTPVYLSSAKFLSINQLLFIQNFSYKYSFIQ